MHFNLIVNGYAVKSTELKITRQTLYKIEKIDNYQYYVCHYVVDGHMCNFLFHLKSIFQVVNGK